MSTTPNTSGNTSGSATIGTPGTAPSTSRYPAMFARLREAGEGAFIPFLMLADPDPQTSLALVDAVVEAGADALELGIGFSDPVADGPVIQAAHVRTVAGGDVLETALGQLREIRRRYPQLPIGILSYANMAFAPGPQVFFSQLAQAGVDAVLLADVPLREGAEIRQAAAQAGLDPIFIASPDSNDTVLQALAQLPSGYIYLVSRPGVTGANTTGSASGASPEDTAAMVSKTARRLRELGSVPVLQGFGISRPEQVSQALAGGVDGVFCGSAIVRLINDYCEQGGGSLPQLQQKVADLVRQLKAATRPQGEARR